MSSSPILTSASSSTSSSSSSSSSSTSTNSTSSTSTSNSPSTPATSPPLSGSSSPSLELKPQRPSVLSLRPQSGPSVRPGAATPTSGSGTATPTGTSGTGSTTPTTTSSTSSTSTTSATGSTSSTEVPKKSYAGVSSTPAPSSTTSTRGGYASRVAGTRGGASSRPTGDRGRDTTTRTGTSTNTTTTSTTGTPTKSTPALRVSDRYSQPRTNDNKRNTPSISIPEKATNSPPLESSASPSSHALEHEWTLWFDSRSTQPAVRAKNEWGANLKEVGTFSDVEGFWRYYHHIQKPSQIEINANYHIFKKGIRPAWEDPANQHGGKWSIKIGNRERQHLDAYWQNLLLSLLGETLDSNDEITGAVVSRRRGGDRITVWNRHKDDTRAIDEIGARLRSILPEDVTSNALFELSYDVHGDNVQQFSKGGGNTGGE